MVEINDILVSGITVTNYFSATTINTSSLIVGGNIVNLNNSSFNQLSATTLSGGTIYSGSTDINTLFADKIHTHNISDVNNLLNSLNSKPNLSGATFTGTVFAPALSATTISGGTFYSGSTPLENIFITAAGALTSIQNGTNTFTGGTSTRPTVNITAATLANLTVSGTGLFNSLSATTLSGGTIYSGTTDLGFTFFSTGATNISKMVSINTGDSNTVVNTTSETILSANTTTYIIPANTLTARKIVRIRVWGKFSTKNGSVGTFTFRLKRGTTTLNTIAASLGSAVTNAGALLDSQIQFRTSGSGGTATSHLMGIFDSASSSNQSSFVNSSNGPITWNTTIANTVQFSVQWATADSLNSFTMEQIFFELLN